jgi:hypothetical protein
MVDLAWYLGAMAEPDWFRRIGRAEEDGFLIQHDVEA